MALIDKLFDATMPGLQKAMDLTWKRNQAISSNVANAETPQYRAVEMNFASELENAFHGERRSNLATTDGRHLDTADRGAARLVSDFSGATKPDGNNVDIDLQMGKLAANAGKFETAAEILKRKFRMVKYVIRSAG